MTNKCNQNIHLQEQASRNEYQYNAATRIKKCIVSKRLVMEVKLCKTRKLKPFFKAKPCIFIK